MTTRPAILLPSRPGSVLPADSSLPGPGGELRSPAPLLIMIDLHQTLHIS